MKVIMFVKLNYQNSKKKKKKSLDGTKAILKTKGISE